MLSTILLIVFLGALVLFYFYTKIRFKKSAHPPHQIDPAAQAVYESKKGKNEKKLTIKERLELSWKFLYEITEIILNKFSLEDREEVNKVGKTLLKLGARYEHVVDLGIRPTISKVQNIDVMPEKEQGGSRTV